MGETHHFAQTPQTVESDSCILDAGNALFQVRSSVSKPFDIRSAAGSKGKQSVLADKCLPSHWRILIYLSPLCYSFHDTRNYMFEINSRAAVSPRPKQAISAPRYPGAL
jgi:hypothetical protein